MAEGEPEKGDGQEREAARGSGIAYAAGLSIFFSVLTCMGSAGRSTVTSARAG